MQRENFRRMKSSFDVVMCLAWLQAGRQAKLSLFGLGQAMGDGPARALAQLRPQLWLCDHQLTCHYQQPLALVTINNDNDPTVIKDNLNTTPQAHVTTSPPHHHQQPPTTSTYHNVSNSPPGSSCYQNNNDDWSSRHICLELQVCFFMFLFIYSTDNYYL